MTSEDPCFTAYATDGHIQCKDLIDLLKRSGIHADDPRARNLFRSLKSAPAALDREAFAAIKAQSTLLIEQVMTGNLAIADFDAFTTELETIFDQTMANEQGKLANYIPQLERVDPAKYAMAVCTVDGQRFALGDADDYFCVQSCSKPITYCLALDELGEETVHNYVGREPSGKTFNELTLNNRGLPHNPMINAGAIMCGALIKPGAEASDRFDFVIDKWKECAGGLHVGFNNAVHLSEKQTADRNFALGYFMREKKAFPPDCNLLDILEFYFQCCSIEVTTKAMAIIAATLANGGNCPVTGAQVFRPDHIKHCLSLMSSCGMYDFSGEFAFSIGIPAKSGVSGGIMLVVPNLMGIAVWSPRLDELGNSVRGVDFCRRLVNRFRLHTFDSMTGLEDDRLDPRRPVTLNTGNPGNNMQTTVNFLWAACQGDLLEMRKLVARGLDVNTADYDGRRAVHLAASEGRSECLRFLISHGADLDATDRWGHTALDDARRGDHAAIIALLTEHGAKSNNHSAKHT